MCPSPLRKPSSLAPVRLACASLSTVIMAAAGFWQPVFSAFCQGLFIFPIPPPAWSSIKGLPRKIPRSGVEGSGVFLLSTFSMGAGGTPQFLLRRRSGLCVFWMKTSSSPLCTGSWQENVLLCSLAENRAAALGKRRAGLTRHLGRGVCAVLSLESTLSRQSSHSARLSWPCSVLAFIL